MATAGELTFQLNRLAETSGLEMVGAANAWAGTSNLELLGALNSVITTSHPSAVTNPSLMLALNGICNALAGTSGMEPAAALGTLGTAATLPVTSGLVLWLDASQIAGQVDNTGVASWPDMSGAGHTVAQATGANQPTYHSTGALLTPTPKPVVTFDGSNDVLLNAVTGLNLSTSFLVMATTNATGSLGWVSDPNDNTTAADYAWITAGVATAWDVGSQAAGEGLYAATRIFKDGTASTVITNDGTWHVYSADVTGGNATPTFDTGLCIGADRFTSLGRNTQGSIAEIIAYDRILTLAERQSVEAALKTKYGTP